MPTVSRSIVIAAPRQQVFDISQDYAIRLDWDPFLRELTFLGGAGQAAPGVQVHVQAKSGLRMVVEYVTVDRPRRVAVRMVRGPWFFARFAGGWIFRESDAAGSSPGSAARTEVHFRYNFATRVPLASGLVDRVVGRVLARDVAARLRGLQRYAEARR
ncbi:MAG: SRPBCC family protein [Myxococcota bacterium]